MLRRASEPDSTTLEVLLASALPKMKCTACDGVGLQIDQQFEDQSDDWNEWGEEAKNCEQCGQRIPPERLELYPQSTRCAACESAPIEKTEDDYCPRCGNVLTMRTSGAGLTRYRYFCSVCKR